MLAACCTICARCRCGDRGPKHGGQAPQLEDIAGAKHWDNMPDQGFTVHRVDNKLIRFVERSDAKQADVSTPRREVRSNPKSGSSLMRPRCPKSARKRLMHRSKQRRYSITSSAAISKPGGTVRPSSFAVLRFTTVSYLVGTCTGRSAGFAPRRIRST
jgi:hypothetical protein